MSRERNYACFSVWAWVRRTTALAIGLTALHGAEPSGSRPNIILILADDMGYSDIGCFGAEIPTPNIDSLAAKGVRFTQFYNNGVCCPSRASLLTGLYPHQAGVGWMVLHGEDSRPPGPYQGYLNDKCVTLAEVLKTAGYRTLMSGKWHVGESRPHWPIDRGFDRSFGLISGASNFFHLAKDYVPGIKRTMFLDDRVYQPPEQGFYMTDAITQRAVEFLDAEKAKSQPLFLYLAYTAPHSPLHALPPDIAKYQGKYRRGWDASREARFQRMRALGIVGSKTTLHPRDAEVAAWAEVEEQEWMDLRMAIYAAQMEAMDRGIGEVLAKLKEIGREQTTVIMFLSDNGASAGDLSRFRTKEFNRAPYLGGIESYDAYGRGWANVSNTPLRSFKTQMYEGGICTPLIVSGPVAGLKPGSVRPETGHVVDLMATAVDIAGARYPQEYQGRHILPVEGVSLLPALRGQKIPPRNPIYWELEGRRAMRDGPWKIVGSEEGRWELYNISTDRTERQDLAESNSARVRSMAEKYEEWARRCGVQSWKTVSPYLQNIRGLR